MPGNDDALSELMGLGMGSDEILKLLDQGISAEEILASVRRMQERGEWSRQTIGSEEWPPPTPFESADLPDFPTESLPGPLSAFVEGLAESTQTPEEMGGLLSLGVLAAILQKKFRVEVTPDWSEVLSLWCVAVAEPGERKSAVFNALLRPVREYEATVREANAAAVAQSAAERKLLENRLNAALRPRSNASLAEQECEVAELTARLAAFEDKHPFRLLVNDTTPEKLVDLMEQQHGALSIASTEGGIFETLSGRYEKNTPLDVYLQGHDGDPICIDRLGRRGNDIASPRLSMLLAIQPVVLAGLMGNNSFRGKGLCARFLYAVCRSKVGFRDVTPHPIPQAVKANYDGFIQDLLTSPYQGVIRLSSEAHDFLRAYQSEVEGALRDEWASMRDWAGKLVGETVRIAALFHAASVTGDPTQIPISSEQMGAAMSVTGVLAAHAKVAYQRMGADRVTDDARYILRKLSGCGDGCISKTDLTRLCRGKFDKTADMFPALDILENRGYIRTEEEAAYNGRKKINFLIHPAVWRKDG